MATIYPFGFMGPIAPGDTYGANPTVGSGNPTLSMGSTAVNIGNTTGGSGNTTVSLGPSAFEQAWLNANRDGAARDAFGTRVPARGEVARLIKNWYLNPENINTAPYLVDSRILTEL